MREAGAFGTSLGLIGGMALVTYLTRAVCLVTLGTAAVPPLLERALRYVPVGVLASLIAPQVLMAESQWNLRLDNALIWGSLACGLTAYRARSPLLAVAAGMAVVALVRLL